MPRIAARAFAIGTFPAGVTDSQNRMWKPKDDSVASLICFHLVMPDRPGWGTEPVEEALRAHPPKGPTGLLSYGRKI